MKRKLGLILLPIAFLAALPAFAQTPTGTPAFSYALIQGSVTTPFAANQAVILPTTNVGSSTSLFVRVTNTGNGAGTVDTISAANQAFQLAGLPGLPATINPGGSILFELTFTPTQIGVATGLFRIGTDTFILQGTGAGAHLVYSFGSGSNLAPVVPAGNVVFAPAQIGQNSNLTFVVQNTGTVAATITSVGTASPKSAFQIQNPPALPLNIAPNASASFTIQFSPANTGISSDTLIVGTDTFALSGIGKAPPPLPAYSFSGASGTVTAFQQPAIGLALSAPYPIALTGTLTLSVTSDSFAADPAVQFGSGGLTVSFTVPANATQALFNGVSPQIKLQTGTVASTIAITPSFSTSGGYNLTPGSPSTLTLTVAPAAPVLLSAQITATAASSFSIAIVGYATSRSMQKLNVQLTPAAGFSLPTTQFTVDASSAFTLWYQSTASQPYGSLFSVTIPFSLAGTVATGQSLTSAIQSVAITAVNEIGTSNSVSIPLQ